MTERLILGKVLRLDADPALTGPGPIATTAHGALRIKDGLIAEIGTAERCAPPIPPARRRLRRNLILPGFIDAHAHYPQTAIIASWGKRLIDWLNTYTFPEEMRFSDPAYAAGNRGRYLDLLLAHGTTTVCSYCTIHPKASRRSSPRRRRAACASRGQDLHGPRHRARGPARHRAIGL
jgi:guanine deaminase